MADEGGEKTEMPTPKKLRDAREKGQVCTSKDVVSTAILVVLLAVSGVMGVALADDVGELTRFVGLRIVENDVVSIRETGKLAVFIICKYSFMFAAIAALVGVVANMVQIGFLFTFQYNVLSSALRGIGDSKTPVYFLSVSCIINAFLDVLLVALILIFSFITKKSVFGRHLYAMGGNRNAARLSGVKTQQLLFLAYVNMGFLAALAGIMTIARLTSAQPTYGQNYEMDAIGSCFIGGASAYGGTGTVPGVIIGAVLMGVINIGMSIMGVDANYQKVVKGLVLLAAVIFDVVSKKEKA